MKVFATTLLTIGALSAPGTASACDQSYTVKQYKAYASKVYKRKKVSEDAQRLMNRMRSCVPTAEQKKAISKHHKRLLVQRRALRCSNFNPVACIRLAANRYNISFSWLLACARSEGGVGPRDYTKMNHQGSGAGGNFQFMSSTFSATIRRMGLSPKPWLNARWQALAAAFKFKHDGSGEWTGRGC